MDYFIVKTSGSQYLVSPGDVLDLPNLDVKEGDTISFDEILLQKVGEKVEIGKPLVSGVSLKAVVLKNYKDEKVDVFKFKAKSRYRRKMGFRAMLTKIKFAGGPEEVKAVEKPAAKKTVVTAEKKKAATKKV